jgi:hypothetical protein
LRRVSSRRISYSFRINSASAAVAMRFLIFY